MDALNPFRYRGYAYDGGDRGFPCPVYGRGVLHRERENVFSILTRKPDENIGSRQT